MSMVIPTREHIEGETIGDERSEVVSLGSIYDIVILNSEKTGTSDEAVTTTQLVRPEP